ncbi:porin family protein [Mesorhizobium sp. VK4C]|uniref:outer membrane protein n=1 Tax=Mesorhizobium captivum TaxID=3072319 RepID=UPI002A23D975|nr:outer membrane protein [Mesorhizobium sp. VK4C]MDX8497381.1 porin family protein [Mesorhizobium sp. VK4C]
MNIAKTLVLTSLALGASVFINVGCANAGDATPSWSGAYIGANLGYGWDSGKVGLSPSTDVPELQDFLDDIIASDSFPSAISPSAQGVIGGGQAGYNWQLPSGWVVGIEADLQASGISGSKSEARFPEFFDTTSTSVEKKIDWFGTLRGRAGYLVDPQWLVYATGGLAFGETSLSYSEVDVTASCIPDATICGDHTASGTHAGWAVGAGVETMLAPNWSVKAEYLYVDLGKRSFKAATNTPIDFNVSAKYHEQTARIGLNYHFD